MQDRVSAPPQGQNYFSGSSYELLTSARRVLVLVQLFYRFSMCACLVTVASICVSDHFLSGSSLNLSKQEYLIGGVQT